MKLHRLLLRTLLLAGSLGIVAADTALASSPPPPTYTIGVSCTGLAGSYARNYKVHLVYYYNGTNFYDHRSTEGLGLFVPVSSQRWQKGGPLRITATMFSLSTGAQCGSYDQSFTFNGRGGAIQIMDPAGSGAIVNAPFVNIDWGSFMGITFQ